MFYADDVSIYNNVTVSQCTMYPNLKLFPSEQLYKIESLKSFMEATTTGQVDQLWTKEKCSSHPQPLLGKVKTAGQGCGLHASSRGSLECQMKLWDSQHIVHVM